MPKKSGVFHKSWYLGFMLLVASACVTPGTQTTVTSGQGGPSIQEAQAEAYNGPKARIAVAQFKDKTGGGHRWWNPQIGDGMADQLTTALFNSNRFIVLERETLGNVLTEQDLGAAGRVSKETSAPIGQIEGAELLVVGAVTEFEGSAEGGGGAIGGGAVGAVLGGIAAGYKKAHMAIDVRIIDARTSRVLAATSVQGEASDVNMGAALGGAFGGGGLGAALGGWKNTPIEKALRVCINEAVNFIASKTPQQYYHYSEAPASVESKPAPQTPSSSGAVDRSVVQEMQNILNSLGYNVGTADGVAGKMTRAAVSKFQANQGLEATGQLDQQTIAKLRALKPNG